MDGQRDRTAGAVVTAGETCLGTFGPFPVATPWWADVEPVAAHLTAALGVPVMVLRLVGVEGGAHAGGGHVTYHAEAFGRPRPGLLGPPPRDLGGLLDPAPRRSGWATADGLRRALAWAEASLRAAGLPPAGPPRQVKTWNLSGLFRIPTASGPVWLKATPAFTTPEAEPIGLLADVDAEIVPAVLAEDRERGWTLLSHLPGEDCWDAPPDVVSTMIGRWVEVQAAVAERLDRTPHGLPDRAPRTLPERVHALLDGAAAAPLAEDERSAARRLADALPARVRALEECGLPRTVVHADFHPGNWRSDGRRTAVVDFADSHAGNPVLDGLRARDFLPERLRRQAADAWTAAWSACVPGSDPGRALALAGPLGHLTYAVRYQEFLDGIEDGERVYHEGDPAREIRAALARARTA
ncbi:hypothetical protein GCM10010466_53540 [Planomonospora alba]|uniref:Aminoglycoside phosphotransferase domain-containing protein n=1 Tax=Planomonospora alba TaxID=161354 RepID=A0ABP6NQK3_9ACTN